MDKHNVPSSLVRAVGYDEPAETLEVEFQNGRVYQYYGVPEQMHTQFMAAPSKGQFLNIHIKNRYPYSRVG